MVIRSSLSNAREKSRSIDKTGTTQFLLQLPGLTALYFINNSVLHSIAPRCNHLYMWPLAQPQIKISKIQDCIGYWNAPDRWGVVTSQNGQKLTVSNSQDVVNWSETFLSLQRNANIKYFKIKMRKKNPQTRIIYHLCGNIIWKEFRNTWTQISITVILFASFKDVFSARIWEIERININVLLLKW